MRPASRRSGSREVARSTSGTRRTRARGRTAHAVELERHRHRVREARRSTREAACSLHSSTTCSGGGPSEIDTRGGIVNNGMVVAATSGQLGDQKWAIGGQRTIGGSFLNNGLRHRRQPAGADRPRHVPERRLGHRRHVRGAAGAGARDPHGAASARGAGPTHRSSTGAAGRSTSRAGTRAPTMSRGSFTIDGPSSFVQAGGKTKGAPLFDVGAALAYKGTGATTIGIARSAAISGTHPGRLGACAQRPARRRRGDLRRRADRRYRARGPDASRRARPRSATAPQPMQLALRQRP